MKYAMSDIHGDYKNFVKMLKKIQFSQKDTLYIIGDIFDKGTENLRVYWKIRKNKNMILIKGNHEYLCERYLSGEIDGAFWDICGGKSTRKETDQLSDEEKQELYEFLHGLPVFLTVEAGGKEYFLTHSGYRQECRVMKSEHVIDAEASIKKAVEKDQEWYLFSEEIHRLPPDMKFDRQMIVGHYPTLFIKGYHRPEIYENGVYTDLDTGNERRKENGRLACLRLDDWKKFYV